MKRKGAKITTLSGFQDMPNFLCGGFLGWFWVGQQEDVLLVEGECECFGDHTPLLDPGVAQCWPQQRLLCLCSHWLWKCLFAYRLASPGFDYLSLFFLIG